MANRGNRGPMAQSDEEKKRKGTFQPVRALKGRTVESELVEIGEPPIDFTEAQQRQWAIHATSLNKLRIVTEADMLKVREFAIVGAMMNKARIKVDIDGECCEIGGTLKKNPWFEIYLTAHDRYMKLCNELGLDIKSRQRMEPPKTKEDETKEKSDNILSSLLSKKPQLNG